METFSALLAICAGNSPVTGEFTAQRPVTRSFDAFFDLRLNKPLSKQSWGWWLETASRPLWRKCNGQVVNSLMLCLRWRIGSTLRWRHMNAMWFQITGNSTVSLTAYAVPHQRNIKVRITGPLWREFTGGRWIPPHKMSGTRKMFPFDDVIVSF